MNSAPPSPIVVSGFEEVQQQFKTWRETKIGRERIPDSLWQAAAEVFHNGEHSLHKISKTLRLNHTSLKQHVAQHLPSTIESERIKPQILVLSRRAKIGASCRVKVPIGKKGSNVLL